jgi:hypothetical protein
LYLKLTRTLTCTWHLTSDRSNISVLPLNITQCITFYLPPVQVPGMWTLVLCMDSTWCTTYLPGKCGHRQLTLRDAPPRNNNSNSILPVQVVFLQLQVLLEFFCTTSWYWSTQIRFLVPNRKNVTDRQTQNFRSGTHGNYERIANFQELSRICPQRCGSM